MAKHDKDRKKGASGRAEKSGDPATGKRPAGGKADRKAAAGHHAARAHGLPASVDASLPATREELMARHADARKRRNSAPLDSEAFRAAVDEIGRIEVRVAAIERDLVPPMG
jgi:hypothetical protein